MAETPSGYFPDYFISFDVQHLADHVTEIISARNGREQRRPLYPVAGLRRFSGSMELLDQASRKEVWDFLQLQRGRLSSFYYFIHIPEQIASFDIGTVSGATSIVAPFKGIWFKGKTPVASTLSTILVGGVAPTSPVVTPNIGPGGEDRISWTGLMSGAVVVSGKVRQRIVVRADRDTIQQAFRQNAADVLPIFSISLKEVL